MSILQLYNADAIGVAGTRICALSECSEATVRREINGAYYLEFKMPAGAQFENEIRVGRAVKSTVNENKGTAYFIIKKRRRTLSGGMSVYAEHQSYYYDSVILRGGGASAAATSSLVFNQDVNSTHPSVSGLGTFTNSLTGKTTITKATPLVSSPTTLRADLLGRLVKTFGGEYSFKGFNISWLDRVGYNRGAVYRYGVNLTDMESEDVLDGYASGIFPYWGSLDPRTNTGIVTIDSWTLDYPGTYPLQVYKPVDFTKQFETQPTPAQLLAAAQEYVAKNAPSGIPVSIKASRARIEGDVIVGLGDTVTIINTPWGINQQTRIFALNFDPLRDITRDVEFGTVNTGFAGAVKDMK